jgi:magnesium transporter
MTMLAVFLPVIAGQGGNAGAQSLAIVMREVPPHKRKHLIAKETLLGLMSGAVTGIITGIVACLWYGSAMLGLVVALGMVTTRIIAGFAGASIPLFMKGLRLDPGPVLDGHSHDHH